MRLKSGSNRLTSDGNPLVNKRVPSYIIIRGIVEQNDPRIPAPDPEAIDLSTMPHYLVPSIGNVVRVFFGPASGYLIVAIPAEARTKRIWIITSDNRGYIKDAEINNGSYDHLFSNPVIVTYMNQKYNLYISNYITVVNGEMQLISNE